MKVVGLTGGIGSGKSTVAKFFTDLGIPVYIADDEAKKIMETSAGVRQEIKALLGENSYKGKKPDRSLIASKVFKDKVLLGSLNNIIHPKVRAHFDKWRQKQNAPYVLYEAAILFESGGQDRFDCSILVTAPKETRIQRLIERDGTGREEISSRMAAQWGDEKKRKLADFQIENKQMPQTKQQVRDIHKKLLQF